MQIYYLIKSKPFLGNVQWAVYSNTLRKKRFRESRSWFKRNALMLAVQQQHDINSLEREYFGFTPDYANAGNILSWLDYTTHDVNRAGRLRTMEK